MLLVLGLQALAVFLIALAGWAGGMLTPIVGVHAVLALAAMPLIAGAMGHFVPVLTRSGDAPRGVRWAPGVLLLAGALAIGFVAGWGGLGFLHGAVGLVCGVVVALLLWIMRRARRALGTPHPGWLWYLAALACLLGGVLFRAAYRACASQPVRFCRPDGARHAACAATDRVWCARSADDCAPAS